MPASVSVVYPKGVKFDMNYYLNTHMPLVHSKWSNQGLKAWEVVQYDSESPYCVQATLKFDSTADFEKAAGGPDAEEIFGDIKNFTDGQPTIMKGETQKTS